MFIESRSLPSELVWRLLKDVVEHRDLADVTTLGDSTVMYQIPNRLASGQTKDDD